MSAETGRHRRLEIAHVLFVDIVGYSKLLLNEQSEILDELNEVVRSTEQVRLAQDAGILLRLPTGDGVALIFRGSPEAPAQCALEIARALKSHPKLQLRMGIHSGPINEVTGADDRSNIAGAGINIAQRVMDCGDAGHILLSKRVAQDLESHERWRPYLHDLGEVTVKHGVSIHIVNLYTDNLGAAKVPAKIQRERDAKAILARRARSKGRNAVIFGSLIALAAIALGFFLLRDRLLRRPIDTQVDAKGIAVLPFENLSKEAENAFFAEGIQDDLLTNLAKIKALRVISRTSVMKYRDVGERNIRAIAQALGVANILEGSVRRERDRVVVNAQLIDARSDRHIWANRYDRTLADSLGLEGQLAAEIADALRASLTPDEKARIERKPTDNADAWTLYLRAIPIEEGPDTLLQDFKRAEDLYSEAVKLDPDFALAHARLASTCARIFHFYEPTDSRKVKARSEAEIALRLQPNLGEGHIALGECFYWMDSDYERALSEFAAAQELLPNDGYIGMLVAAIRRRQGRWQESLETFERVQKVDPQNPNIVRNLLFTETSMRRWDEAAVVAARLRALAPDSLVGKIQSGYVEFMRKGETATLKNLLAQVPTGVDPDGAVTGAWWEAAMLERDFARAADVLEKSRLTEISYFNGGLTPKSFLAGITALARNDRVIADENFAAALPQLEKELQEAPDAADRHATLGLLYAFMGRHDDAIREGRRAVELKPESKDAYDGAIMNCCLALIYSRVGEKELAIPLIERLLKTPGAVDSVDYSITVSDLKHRWEWDPIRNDPRFQKILADAVK
jgi:TolB-like protein/class 3 adenylate cyclase/Flp pilus assembly protein TadD